MLPAPDQPVPLTGYRAVCSIAAGPGLPPTKHPPEGSRLSAPGLWTRSVRQIGALRQPSALSREGACRSARYLAGSFLCRADGGGSPCCKPGEHAPPMLAVFTPGSFPMVPDKSLPPPHPPAFRESWCRMGAVSIENNHLPLETKPMVGGALWDVLEGLSNSR